MDKIKADRIIEQESLIRGADSRLVLSALIHDQPYSDDYANILSSDEYSRLQASYKDALGTLPQTALETKYAPFYHMAYQQCPDFKWVVESGAHDAKSINISVPKARGLRLSLLSLLLNRAPYSAPLLSDQYKTLGRLDSNIDKLLTEYMRAVDAVYPPEKVMQRLIGWIEREMLNSDGCEIFMPLCPDYSTEPTGNPTCPLRHNFKGIGDGLGPVAMRLANALPVFKDLLHELGIKASFTAVMADFEGFTKSNLAHVGIMEEQFMQRADSSRKKFQELTGVTTHMMSDLVGGKDIWLSLRKSVNDAYKKGRYGNADITQRTLVEIVKKRRALYERWYGIKDSLEEYTGIVLEQSVDYVIMAKHITEKMHNPLVFAADANVFEPFYCFYDDIPTLYLRKHYC